MSTTLGFSEINYTEGTNKSTVKKNQTRRRSRSRPLLSKARTFLNSMKNSDDNDNKVNDSLKKARQAKEAKRQARKNEEEALNKETEEIIIATDTSLEGDATSIYLATLLEKIEYEIK